MSFPTHNRFEVDTRWFHERLRESELTVSKLARILGDDKATVSRTINGRRRMKETEAPAYASQFGVSALDVMVAARLAPPKFGRVLESGYIERSPDKVHVRDQVSLELSRETYARIDTTPRSAADLGSGKTGIAVLATGESVFGQMTKGSVPGSVTIRLMWSGQVLENEKAKNLYFVAPYALS